MTEFFTRNAVQLKLWLQLIFHLDGQGKASKTYVLSKLNNILCCLAKSKHPKEIFEGNFLFTSAAIRHFSFFSISMYLCASFFTRDKDTSFLLGFYYTGNWNVMATTTLVKRACVHFLTLGSKGTECTHHRWTFLPAKIGVHKVHTEDGSWDNSWSVFGQCQEGYGLLAKKIPGTMLTIQFSWWSWDTTLPWPCLICSYRERLYKYIPWKLRDVQL